MHPDVAISSQAGDLRFVAQCARQQQQTAGRFIIPVTSVEALKAALAAANEPAEFKIYPGAPHGFHADYRASYRKEAAEDAWNRMQAWFKKYNVLG
jgi:dienelactone hydrolase